MNDDTTLTAVRHSLQVLRGSLDEVRLDIPAEQIMARARRHRLRRGLSLASVAATACVAAVLAVILALPGGGRLPGGATARAVHVNLAAWSVNTRPDGTVSFRLRNTSDPGRLQHALAAAGVPAMVRWGQICLAQGRHVLQPTWGFVRTDFPGPQPGSVFLLYGGSKPLNWRWTITPAKIPAGDRFVISAVPPGAAGRGQIQAAWEFVPASAPIRCR